MRGSGPRSKRSTALPRSRCLCLALCHSFHIHTQRATASPALIPTKRSVTLKTRASRRRRRSGTPSPSSPPTTRLFSQQQQQQCRPTRRTTLDRRDRRRSLRRERRRKAAHWRVRSVRPLRLAPLQLLLPTATATRILAQLVRLRPRRLRRLLHQWRRRRSSHLAVPNIRSTIPTSYRPQP